MPERLPFPLRAYRGLAAAATPFMPLVWSRRARNGKEHPTRGRERKGEATVRRPNAPLIWMHGASVGEMMSIMPLIHHFPAHGFAVLVTSGTLTSARVAEARFPDGAVHQFIPYDNPRYVRRFLDYWQPDLALFAESDLWPNLITTASQRGIPMMLLNGRVSERSFTRWRKAPKSIAALLGKFDLCLAQSVQDAERYSELGAPRVLFTGNLKLDVPAPPADEQALQEFRAAIGNRPVIAAASTHPGEEKLVIDLHRELHQSFPGLLTLIAPRHPERGPGVLEIARVAGVRAVARSAGSLPDRRTDVYVADTIGELGIIYRAAPIVFMGGSLVRHGGQNPIEPAKLGAAIVHGPHVWNFAEIYAALDQAQGAAEVGDEATLMNRIATWLANPHKRMAAADAATQTVESLAGARTRTLAALEPYLLQLRLQYR
ncbi:MAG: 3-deoxy-D-manno-octulosonic-acid transferase [Variibacter sp.]|nr:3-deoxy-D-manno-octulosonic-acid transferase [Variibacter sp.]